MSKHNKLRLSAQFDVLAFYNFWDPDIQTEKNGQVFLESVVIANQDYK